MKTDVRRHDMQFKRSAILDAPKEIKAIQRIVIAFFLLMISACDFRPPQYYSKVIMEVKPVNGHGFDNPERFPVRKNVKPADFSSKEILYPVINNLKLSETWANGGRKLSLDQAYDRLVNSIRVIEVRNTDLIEISVHSADRQKAADIANMIAAVYKRKYNNDQLAQIEHGLAPLQLAIDQQRKAITVAKDELQRIRMANGISDSNPETSGDGTPAQQAQVRKDDVVALGGKAKGGPNDDQVARRKIADYLSAKDNYIIAKHILSMMEDRFTTDEIEMQESRTVAKIWEGASPSKHGSWFQNWHR